MKKKRKVENWLKNEFIGINNNKLKNLWLDNIFLPNLNEIHK